MSDVSEAVTTYVCVGCGDKIVDGDEIWRNGETFHDKCWHEAHGEMRNVLEGMSEGEVALLELGLKDLEQEAAENPQILEKHGDDLKRLRERVNNLRYDAKTKADAQRIQFLKRQMSTMKDEHEEIRERLLEKLDNGVHIIAGVEVEVRTRAGKKSLDTGSLAEEVGEDIIKKHTKQLDDVTELRVDY